MPERLTRFSRNSQLAKFGSMSTLRSVNWTRNEAWPIQVMATWPRLSFGKFGLRGWPTRAGSGGRFVQTISRKNVRGLKWFDGVNSLNDRGNRGLRAGRMT